MRDPIDAFSVEDRRRFTIIAGLALFNAAFLPFASFQVRWSSAVPVILASLLLISIAVFYRRVRPAERIASMAMGTATLLLFAALLSLGTYLIGGFGRPLIDPYLAAFDQALGLDWPATLEMVQAAPMAKKLLTLAYLSTLPQIVVTVVVLGLTGRSERLDVVLLALFVAGLAAGLFWALFPSFGAFPFYYRSGMALNDAALVLNRPYADHLYQVYDGTITAIGMDEMRGLIGFPSFHTTLAVLTVYALYPIRIVGPIALVLNALVILSVPVDGGHHFVDVPAGAALAVLAIIWSQRLVLRRGRDVAGPLIGVAPLGAADSNYNRLPPRRKGACSASTRASSSTCRRSSTR